MPTHVAFADVETGEFQNAQELGAISGEVVTEFEGCECDLEDAYVLLGDHDLLLVIDAPSREAVLEASIAIERLGISLTTMEAMEFENLGRIVDDR